MTASFSNEPSMFLTWLAPTLWSIFSSIDVIVYLLQTNDSNERKKARYEQVHDKIKDKAFYNAIMPIYNMFLMDKNIEMLHHYDSQKMRPSNWWWVKLHPHTWFCPGLIIITKYFVSRVNHDSTINIQIKFIMENFYSTEGQNYFEDWIQHINFMRNHSLSWFQIYLIIENNFQIPL